MKILASILLLLAASLGSVAQSRSNARFSDVKPAMKNTCLEKNAVLWANRRAKDELCREVYEKAVIVSDDWELCTDKRRYVTARRIHMVLYGTGQNNRCGMAHFVFYQKHEGRGYFAHRLKGEQTGDFYDAVCE
ncbi:MAG: hypothetical protein V4649_18785 [Bacteroidota bacterium]